MELARNQNDFLVEIFRTGQKYLRSSPRAIKYLESRGVSSDQIEELGLGYIPEDEWPPYIDLEEASEAERLYWEQSNKGSRLKDKLLFPMTNALGHIRGLQARTPDDDRKDYWKYYSPKADIDAVFFGTNIAISRIWETGVIHLVEGIFDLFPVQRIAPNTVCLGTAQISQNQKTFLRRHVDEIRIMSDHDEFGDKLFNNFYADHRDDFDHIQRVSYAGKDPSDSWERLGEEGFRKQFDDEIFYSLSSYQRGAPLRG